MDIAELTAMLTEGLPADQAAVVKAAIERDAVKTKAAGIKAQKEYDAIVQKQNELQAKLDGADGKPGALKYQEWYEANYPQITKLQSDMQKYQEKYGSLDAPATTTTPTTTTTVVPTLSKEEIQRAVDERIQAGYAPKWSDLIVGAGTVIQKHLFAKRKDPIDFKKLAELAQDQRFGGSLDLAYDEYIRPVAEKEAKAATEAEIDRRVKEKLQTLGAWANFSPGADVSTPGTLAPKSKEELTKFDKTSLVPDLVKTWVTARPGGEEQVH